MEWFDTCIGIGVLIALLLLLRVLRSSVISPLASTTLRTARLEERVQALESTSAQIKIDHAEFRRDIARAVAPIHVRLDNQDNTLREIKQLLEENFKPKSGE